MSGAYQTYASRLDGAEIKSYYVASEKPGGAVILLRGVAGPDIGYTEIADRLAAEGYAGLVHTWQVRGNDPTDVTLLADIDAAIIFLKERPELSGQPIAVFGYCKGGGYAVLAAAQSRDICAIVAFHGFARRPDGATETNRNPIDVVNNVSQPVLLLHGECDTLSPVAGMRDLQAAFTKAGGKAEIHTYADADHGFAVSTHKGYKPQAAIDGFGRAIAFLRQHLGGEL